MRIHRPLQTAYLALLAGFGMGFAHWYAKPLVPVGPCQDVMNCIARYVRPGVGVDDLLIGLAAAAATAVVIQIGLLLFDPTARRREQAPRG
jgi:hypothetical protein